MHEAQTKLLEAARLLTEAAALLGTPAPLPQVLQRIATAQEAMQPTQNTSFNQRWVGLGTPAAPLSIPQQVQKQRTGRKNVHKQERAYFYLHIADKTTGKDDIFRVVGDRGLAEANRLEAAALRDTNKVVKRLDSREVQELVSLRLKQIREGIPHYVGSTEAIELTGPINN
jgi:hypothetical protein